MQRQTTALVESMRAGAWTAMGGKQQVCPEYRLKPPGFGHWICQLAPDARWRLNR